MTKQRIIGFALAGAVMSSLAGFPAAANDADVIRWGDCDGASTWKLKASPEDGRIEVEGEVDSNRVGQTWRWRMLHNGELTARGRATTTAPSGSFEVRRLVVDMSSVDRLRFRALHPATGEVCVGRVRF